MPTFSNYCNCSVNMIISISIIYLDSADGLQPGAFFHSLANMPIYSNDIRNNGITYDDRKNETCEKDSRKMDKRFAVCCVIKNYRAKQIPEELFILMVAHDFTLGN